MDSERLKSFLETLIFVSEQPLKVAEMVKAIHTYERAQERAARAAAGEEEEVEASEVADTEQDALSQLESKAQEEEGRIGKSEVQEALQEIQVELQENSARGIVLTEVAGGWQFISRPENAEVIREFFNPKPTKLSKPGLETLSMIAYRQPITRAEIEDIRGVDTGGVLKTLLEKNLVRIVGKKDEPGKPMLYGTTQDFLELFQLKSLKELPSLKDYRDLEAEFQRQAGGDGVVVENEQDSEEEEKSILELSAEAQLTQLDDAEEEVLQGLEESLHEVRHKEKEIFAEEKKESESPQ